MCKEFAFNQCTTSTFLAHTVRFISWNRHKGPPYLGGEVAQKVKGLQWGGRVTTWSFMRQAGAIVGVRLTLILTLVSFAIVGAKAGHGVWGLCNFFF